MIYWPTNTAEVRWDFPNNFQFKDGNLPDGFWLECRNDVGLWILDGDITADTVDPGYIHCAFDQIPEGEDGGIFPTKGEYTYKLYAWWDPERESEDARTQLISEGLMIVGSYEEARTEYDNAVEYEQYTEN